MDIVAEIGSSWGGDYDILERMLEDLSESGIKTVKFQAYNLEFVAKHILEFPHVEKSSITENNIRLIFDMCQRNNLEFFCTPTYLRSVEFLNPYVKRWKIRFKDNLNSKLLNLCYDTKKPLYVSTDHLSTLYDKCIYCHEKKPVLYDELNWHDVKNFDGFSSHDPTHLSVRNAIRLEMDYIEFHVTPDHDLRLIDNLYSFDMDEVRVIMEYAQCLV